MGEAKGYIGDLAERQPVIYEEWVTILDMRAQDFLVQQFNSGKTMLLFGVEVYVQAIRSLGHGIIKVKFISA